MTPEFRQLLTELKAVLEKHNAYIAADSPVCRDNCYCYVGSRGTGFIRRSFTRITPDILSRLIDLD